MNQSYGKPQRPVHHVAVREAPPAQTDLPFDHIKKIHAWRQQAAALGSPFYRIGLIGRTGGATDKTINWGKSKDNAPETFYSAGDVEALIGTLRQRNAIGFDIYVTPIDPLHHYIVLDDMKSGAAGLLASIGHAPCLVQASSVGNEQAIVKVARDASRPNEQSLANKVVQRLNVAHGDPKFCGVIHPFRMAGFSNKKPGKGNAFTRIVFGQHRVCDRAGELLAQLRQADDEARQQQLAAKAERQAQRGVAGRVRTAAVPSRALDALPEHFADGAEPNFRRAVAWVLGWVERCGLNEDQSRIDFRAAMRMLDAGWGAADVEGAILIGSDDLFARHRNPLDYCQRTVRKAALELELERAKAETETARPGVPPPDRA